MKFFVGIFVVIFSILFGYTENGGVIMALWQPFEVLIIVGGSIGAYIISTPLHIIKNTVSYLKMMIKGPVYHEPDYVQLLNLLFMVLKTARTKGLLELEKHIESPHDSMIFMNFPGFLKHKVATEFLCDYCRLFVMGQDNPHNLDDLMTEELALIFEQRYAAVTAFEKMADGMPALGIVAAVLGVIHTMAHINSAPSVLGELIGGALVGTFAGILLSYGIVGPMVQALKQAVETDHKYLICIKTALLSHLNGDVPLIAVECARSVLPEEFRPSFAVMEESLQQFS